MERSDGGREAREARRNRRVVWSEVQRDGSYRGRWVALEGVRYESGTAVEGEVVDSDEDLAELCARIQGTDYVACAILYCDDKASGVRRVNAT